MLVKTKLWCAGVLFGLFAGAWLARADTFLVTNTASSGPGSLSDTLGNLLYGSTNTIGFNIPGTGVRTILLTSALYVPNNTTIDGYTQPGAQPNTLTNGDNAVLLVELRAAAGPPNIALDLGTGCQVRGLVLNGFGSYAISASAGDIIQGNFLGTDPSGTVAEGNEYYGILSSPYGSGGNVLIGGASPAARNLISGNHFGGVEVSGSGVRTVIQGNLIGTDITGTRPLGNAICGTVNFGNTAAMQVGGVNAGEGNVIAFNGLGVWVDTGVSNSILGNSIFANQGPGITMGGVGAGAGVQPAGPGGFAPVLTSVSVSGGTTTVQGRLQGQSNATYRVEFFANPGLDAVGYGQGQMFLGAAGVVTGAGGSGTFAASFSGAYPFVAATATDPAGNTSEFSANYPGTTNRFAPGDLLVALNNGLVQWRHPDGALVRVLNPGFGWNSAPGGMAFDAKGNLYVTGQSNSAVVRFSNTGQSLGVFATNLDGYSADIAFDTAGHAYVAAAQASSQVGEFDATGKLLAEFNPDPQLYGLYRFQLGADHHTAYFDGFINLLVSLYYVPFIERYDLPTQQQQPVLYQTSTNSDAPSIYGFRLLADGGAVLSGDLGLARIGLNPTEPLANGQIIRTYRAPGQTAWGPVALDSDGRSFWAGGFSGSFIYKFDLASGALLARVDTGAYGGIAALAVFGEPDAGTSGLYLGASAAGTSALMNETVTNTLTLLNFHTNALTGVTVTDDLPSGASFSAASSTLGTFSSSSGRVMFNLGTVPAATNVTLTVAFTANATGTLVSSATAAATGPVPENYSASAVVSVEPNPGSLVVTRTGDNGPGSLRAALQAANSAAGAGVVTFNIAGSGVHVIQPLSPLPVLTAPVTIDGYSQPGAAANTSAGGENATISVALDGANAGPLAEGLVLSGGHSLVRGLAVYHFGGNGIVLIGGDGNTLSGNFIGTDATGAAAPNGRNGVLLNNSLENVIGGTVAGERNLISANAGSGIGITGNYTGAETIAGNFIGSGLLPTTPLGNGLDGVLVSASDTLIGGTNGAQANVLAYNRAAGVSVFGTTAYTGQYSTSSPQFTDGVGILGNSIFANAALGIDMAPAGVTLNGPANGSRNGPDGGLNFPVLAPITPNSTSVQGSLASFANGAFRIEVFGSTAPDPSGYGQGETFLGASAVLTDNHGLASFSVPVTAPLTTGEFVTATAVSPDDFDTSEFSAAVRVAPAADLAVSMSASANPATARQDLTYTITVTNQGPGTADNVVLTNQTPPYSTFVSADGGGNTTFGNPPQVFWTLGSMPAGTGTNVHVVVTPTRIGLIAASASVQGLEADPSVADNTATLSVNVTGAPRVLTVTSTADSGAGSLRDAINNVNANGYGADTIQFDIPGGGVQTILLLSDLPAIGEPVVIDGYSQPGSKPNTQVNGDNAVLQIQLQEIGSPYSGTLLWLGAGNSVVRGLALNGVGARGLYLSPSYGSAIQTNILITGNFIGTSPAGVAAATNYLQSGIAVDGNGILNDVQIGGAAPADRNVISGNGGAGASTESGGVWVNNANAVAIQGNYIGTDASGQNPLGNQGDGIALYLGANQALIGGTNAGEGNLIANNATVGVQIGAGTNNAVLGNAIFNNGGLGIHLGFAYANDPGSPTPDHVGLASGPNNLQNYPVLTSLALSGGQTTVQGTLNSQPNTAYRLEFYSNARPSFSFYGEGQTLLGVGAVMTDSGGNAGFRFSFAGAGSNVTATATDPAGNTSEFCADALSAAGPFQVGDLFIGSANGVIQWRRHDGTPVRLLSLGGTNAISALGFDPAGRLVVAANNALERFDTQGNLLGFWATNITALSLAFDAQGDCYVAGGGYNLTGGSGPIWELNNAGVLLSTFSVPADAEAPVYLDLGADQHTIVYTSAGTTVKAYDAATRAPLPALVSNLSSDSIYSAEDVRVLPDGSVLVAGGTSQTAVRFDGHGNLLQTYYATNTSGDSAVLALDPDRQSFWVSTYFSPAYLYRFSLAGGPALLQLPIFLPSVNGSSAAGGSFAIFGEPRAAFVPLPLLSVTSSASNMVISWPASISGFTLQATPSLAPPTWTDLSTTTNWISLPATSTTRFFRLYKP